MSIASSPVAQGTFHVHVYQSASRGLLMARCCAFIASSWSLPSTRGLSTSLPRARQRCWGVSRCLPQEAEGAAWPAPGCEPVSPIPGLPGPPPLLQGQMSALDWPCSARRASRALQQTPAAWHPCPAFAGQLRLPTWLSIA